MTLPAAIKKDTDSTRMLMAALMTCVFSLSLVGCESKPEKRVGVELHGTYRFDDCIVRATLDGKDKLSYQENTELIDYIIFEAVTKASKDLSHPPFQVNTTRSRRYEYYFFFSTLCEKKLEYAESIVSNYYLAGRKKLNIQYDLVSMTKKELPAGLSMPLGWWVDQ